MTERVAPTAWLAPGWSVSAAPHGPRHLVRGRAFRTLQSSKFVSGASSVRSTPESVCVHGAYASCQAHTPAMGTLTGAWHLPRAEKARMLQASPSSCKMPKSSKTDARTTIPSDSYFFLRVQRHPGSDSDIARLCLSLFSLCSSCKSRFRPNNFQSGKN